LTGVSDDSERPDEVERTVDAGLAELGLALAPEDREAVLEGARRLRRAARLVRALEAPGAR
jgi:hypothetical protein